MAESEKKRHPPIVEAIAKAGAVLGAAVGRYKSGGPAHLPKTDKPKKKVKTKGSGRSTTKFARTGGSGGAAGAGLGRGGISPRKFKGGGLVGSPRRKKFI